MIYIEKRKKGDEKWEEISLEKMVDEIELENAKIAGEDMEAAFIDAITNQAQKLSRTRSTLQIALTIALTHKYETTDAEYRII